MSVFHLSIEKFFAESMSWKNKKDININVYLSVISADNFDLVINVMLKYSKQYCVK